MSDVPPAEPSAEAPAPRWQPIGPVDRRVAGVLVEKAKTTPDAYPMTLNAIRTACNQKSNRFPVMQLESDDVEESLDRLRELGAVGFIEGAGRVQKYRHYLYQWLGVEAVELAVLAELLLRGAQTEGELRGRAARMEPVSDLSELRPVLGALKAKNLVLPLTPEGRGHVVCHALYLPKELERIRLEYQPGRRAGLTLPEATPAETSPAVPGTSVPATTPATAPVPPTSPPGVAPEGAEALRRELAEVRDRLSQLRADLDDVVAEQGRLTDEIRSLKEALGG